MLQHDVSVTHVRALDIYEASCWCGWHFRSHFGPALLRAAEIHSLTGDYVAA